MGMSHEIVTNLFSELKAKSEAGDVVGGKETLSKLKVAMLGLPDNGSNSLHMQIAVESLEIGILMMVEDGDLDSFARNVAQIKPLYAALGRTTPKKCHILGLNLMNLLVDNRLSEF